MIDMMRIEELERHAEDRDLIHNVGREYLDSSLNVAQELDMPVVLTPLAHPGQFHGGDTPADFLRYRRATVITTMTDWERGWFGEQGIDPSRVITTGMGANAVRSHDGAAFRARHRIPADAPLVLYVGRRERYKGYIHLLDAAELVWQRHNEARFVFIGVPGFYGAIVDEFARYTDERIIEIERAGAEEKSAALDACDVYAMPSAHETFGIGYLEAWLHEKPVIGGDIPPLREVIAHGVDGLLVRRRRGHRAGRDQSSRRAGAATRDGSRRQREAARAVGLGSRHGPRRGRASAGDRCASARGRGTRLASLRARRHREEASLDDRRLRAVRACPRP